MPLGVAAVFAAAVGQHPAERDAVLLVEGDDPVIEQIGGGDRRLDVVELGEPDLGVGVDEGLLVDATHPLQRADIEGVLGTAVAGTGAVELAMGFLVGLRLLQSGELALGQDQAILRHPGLQSLQPLGHGVEVMALIEMSRRVPNPKNRVAETVERRILELAVEQPAWGHTRMANELAKEGLRVSPTGVRGVSGFAASPPFSYKSLNR